MRIFAVVCGSILLTLNGCGSSTPSATPSPPTSKLDFYNTAVRVSNHSSKCAWVTVWWANGELSPWNLMDGNTTHPRFVRARESHVFGYTLVPKIPLFGALQIKVLAEVKSAGCNQTNLAYKYDVNKDMHPVGIDADVCAYVVEPSYGQFNITKPELCRLSPPASETDPIAGLRQPATISPR